ncbi:MAG: glycosyltransferase family 2 protein [Bryobacterales bacterium]|nr:glycosyltransferase [Bryobacteraceae bacterium]MDW8131970.1 glycosyltransferase family 2 protein [Bryobacterales bacterium]
MAAYPLVSVVTAVYNLADFIEETVLSVLGQDYPRIEYIVMDGGSTDGTLEILAKYRDRVRIISGRDRGTADAINRAFRLSTGEIFAFLNGDDTYLPGAVRTAVECLLAHPEAGGVYGEANWITEDGCVIERYPTHPYDPALLAHECYICQPACFLRREVFLKAGLLDPDLECVFDYDLWIRVSRIAPLVKTDAVLANSRMRRSGKTLGQRRRVFAEALRVLKRHYGYVPFEWIYSYTAFRIDRRDQFFEPLRPSVTKLLASLALGVKWNGWRAPQFLLEWIRWLTPGAAARHWRRLRQRF